MKNISQANEFTKDKEKGFEEEEENEGNFEKLKEVVYQNLESLKKQIPPINIENFIVKEQKSINTENYFNISTISDKNTGQIYEAKSFFLSKGESIESQKKKVNQLSFFSREVMALSKIKHSSIIEFIGYSLEGFNDQKGPVILTKHYRNGSLERIIELEKEGENFEFWNPTKKLISIHKIATAMSYLHSHGILHRDISLGNIFLDDSFLPKLGGFGSSIFLDDIENDNSEIIYGSAPYIAPEIWITNKYSKKSDVYAFAICAYEILTGELLYRDKTDDQIMYMAFSNKPLNFHKSFPIGYRNLIQRCLLNDPERRPSFDEIVNELLINKDFITIDIDEELYHSYIDIYYEELKGVDTTPIINKLFPEDQQNIIYNKLQESNERKEKLDEEEKAEILKSINAKQINIDQFEVIDKNESGGFGYVYKIQDKETKQIYAAKTSRNKKDEIDFLRELKILSEMKHPLIIKLIGYSLTDFDHENNLIIIIEYAINGSLDEILNKDQSKIQEDIKIWNNTYKLINIYGIASAISYLHNNNFIHLDIKPGNVLLDDHLFPKICDFGLSIKVGSKLRNIPNFTGTLLYMAPEKLSEGVSSKEVDIYAFGMLLHEVKANEHLFDKLTPPNIMYKIYHGTDYKIDSTIPTFYKELIKSCINRDPSKRPTIDKILYKLKNQQDLIEDDIDKKFYNSFIEMIELEIKGQNTTTKFPTYQIYEDNFTSSTSTESLSLTSFNDMIDEIEETEEIENKQISNIYEYRHKKTGKKYAVTISNFPIKYIDKEKVKIEAEELLKLNHPCIQRFYGFSSHNKEHQPKPIIINESISQKTLFDIIESERKGKHDPELTPTAKLIIIYGIASGMSYLHSHNINHPRLNPTNIRIDSKFHPQLSEIGFYIRPENSKIIIRTTKKAEDDNILYLSPEKLKLSDNITEKSDVYSYSLVVYEIITNKTPFDKNIRPIEIIKKIVDEKYRPEIQETIPKFYKEMIERCLSYDPNDRPSFSEIIFELENEPSIITSEINRDEYLRYQTFIKQNQNNE